MNICLKGSEYLDQVTVKLTYEQVASQRQSGLASLIIQMLQGGLICIMF